MRTLAVDLGTKRIGLAISDAGGSFAQPLRVITVSDPRQAIDPVIEIVEQEQVRRIVIGLPLNMDDSIGPSARTVVEWARLLQKRLAAQSATDVNSLTGEIACKTVRESESEIVFVDERLSSFAAEQELTVLKKSGVKLTRAGKKQRLDAVAACGFLQEFLNGKLSPIDVERFA